MAKRKNDLMHEIENNLQAVVKGYDSCRPAIINLSDLNMQLTCKDGEIVTVETAMCFTYITVITSNGKRGWCKYEELGESELRFLLNAIRVQLYKENYSPGKYLRAYNPWWFLGKDCNEQLDDILNESQEDYINKIN